MTGNILEPKSPSTHREKKNQQKRLLQVEKRTYQVPQSAPSWYPSPSAQAVYRFQAHIVGSTTKSFHTCHVAHLPQSLRSFRWWTTSTKSRHHDRERALSEGNCSEACYFNERMQRRTYEQPSPSYQLCPLSANTKSAIVQEHLKTLYHIPSGPKNRSSGLPYKSTKGSLMWGVFPGMRRSIIAYRPSGLMSKTAGKVKDMECIHRRISRSTF